MLAELRALAGDPELLALPASLGEVRSGSGETGISLAGERKSWGAFAELPAPLRAAEARLRELLGEVRRHPRVAVRLELARRGDDRARAGDDEHRLGAGAQLAARHAARAWRAWRATCRGRCR